MRGWRPTLAQVLGAGFAGLALLLASLLAVVAQGARGTLLEASGQLLAETSRRLAGAVEGHLAEAEAVLQGVEAARAAGLLSLDEPGPAASALAAELARHPGVSALTLTHATSHGFQAEGPEAGEALLEPGGRWQVSVMRGPDGSLRRAASTGDEATAHPTFTTPARQALQGRAVWSDLSLGEGPGHRRVVTVQQALRGPGGSLSVLRVALWSDRVDELVRVDLEARAGRRPRLFLADAHGHLLARTAPGDKVEEVEGDEVRVVPAALEPGLEGALASPLLGQLGPGEAGQAAFEAGGERWRLDVRALPEGRTQGWLVGTLAPEAYFLGPLEASLRGAQALAAALVLAALGAGGLLLGATRRDLGGLVRETARLKDLDFGPGRGAPARLRDVAEAAHGLELAKTSLRAMGKYVPLDLVRQLYRDRAEPTLGGVVQDVSILFTDIEGFTTVSEALPLEVLAPALGRYLEALTRAVRGRAGIIDKYTGDGVMALWNAPTACPGHPVRACEAVLACQAAVEALFASPAWAGLPRWRTRFGLHRARVSVGHFGSPDRLAYTAMGDGVNLASRLEGLNKQYGTLALVSAEVEREARGAFHLRRLDRVAVKGKHQGVEVYELLGRREGPRPEPVERYERALDAYLERRFGDALMALAAGPLDRAAEVLAARCRRLLAVPPPPDWDGVYVALEK